jgi:hypothetical protein
MTLPSAGRLLLSALLLSACSAKLPAELLTEVNQRVERVDRAGQSLAIGAARLPSRALTADDMAEVRALLDTYLRESDPLNASIRKLADAEPALVLPGVPSALTSRQVRLRVFERLFQQGRTDGQASQRFLAEVPHDGDVDEQIERLGCECTEGRNRECEDAGPVGARRRDPAEHLFEGLGPREPEAQAVPHRLARDEPGRVELGQHPGDVPLRVPPLSEFRGRCPPSGASAEVAQDVGPAADAAQRPCAEPHQGHAFEREGDGTHPRQGRPWRS